MGWYKVPCQSFDYGLASLRTMPWRAQRLKRPILADSACHWQLYLFERGVKEPDSLKLETAMLIRMEREARILQLISSFGDMAGAAACTIIKEALASPDLDPRLRDTFQGLLDLEGVTWPCHTPCHAGVLHCGRQHQTVAQKVTLRDDFSHTATANGRLQASIPLLRLKALRRRNRTNSGSR